MERGEGCQVQNRGRVRPVKTREGSQEIGLIEIRNQSSHLP